MTGEQEGARFLFERRHVEQGSARYAVTIEIAPSEKFTCEAALGATGARLDAFDSSPPSWALDTAVALLRTVAKNHAPRGDWPRRVHRWRASRR